MTTEFRWIQTLGEYLSASNEDQQVMQFFEAEVVPKVRAQIPAGSVRWLEVGPGCGSKTAMIANALGQPMSHKPRVATLVDPVFAERPDIADAIVQQLRRGGLPSRICPHTIEAHVRDADSSIHDCTVLTAIHVAYSGSIAEALLAIIARPATDCGRVSVVVCESARSAFRQMRRRLEDAGVSVPASALATVEDGLRRADAVDYRRFEINGQRCAVSRPEVLDDHEHWLFPFLLGVDPEQFVSASLSLQERVRSIVNDSLRELDVDQLDVPDTALVVFACGPEEKRK